MHPRKELAVKTLIVAVVCAAALASSGHSEAAQISSPIIFGNVDQARAECVVINGGTTALVVTLKIIDAAGALKTMSSCDGSLAAGDFCALTMPIGFIGPFACTATAGSVANLRGAIVLEDAVIDSFGLLQFRAIRSAPLH
jgi:hypothetical protein